LGLLAVTSRFGYISARLAAGNHHWLHRFAKGTARGAMKTNPPGPRPRLCQPGTASDNIKIDAEFAGLIPPLSPKELLALQRSLDAEGCRDPLIVWRDKQILVDGHNRLRYCRDRAYRFAVREMPFPNRESVRAYIIAGQLARRNLSGAAESYLRGKR